MQGLEYWKSLEQLAENPEVIDRISKEFPGYNPDEITSVSRRRFMKLMGASMGLAGLTLGGCRRWPKEHLAPFSANPREHTPGATEQYATIYELGGVGVGLLVTSFDGRPIKVEGNPLHPFSSTFDGKLGSADAFAQASVLELYDPDRSRAIVDRTSAEPRRGAWDELLAVIAGIRSANGQGLAILSESSSSPSVALLRAKLQQAYPQSAWYEYEPISQENELGGANLAFGRPVRSRLHLDKADVIVSLDADLLGAHPAHIRYANDWSKRRRSADAKSGMSRMYVAESGFSITGTVADERLGVRPSRLPSMAQAIAAGIGVAGVQPTTVVFTQAEASFVAAAVADLQRAGRSAVVAAGANLPAPVHALVHAINAKLGATGNTATILDEQRPAAKSIVELCEQIKAGGVKSMVILGGNPAYDAPADLGFADLLSKVGTSVHLSLYDNETSQRCKWHVPRAHYLESWGDARAWDGTVSIQQPLILPLYDGKSTIELLAVLCGDSITDGQRLVRRTHEKLSDADYRRALHDGLVPNSAYPAVTLAPKTAPLDEQPAGADFEVRFTADQKLYDGRFANNGWLQELPDTLSKLTWDNAALISAKDASDKQISNGDVINLSVGGRSLELAAYIQPGQPIGVIGLPLGYGRASAGHVGTGVGFDTYTLRTSAAMHSAAGATIQKTGTVYKLAMTQEHHIIDEVGFRGRQERIGEKGHPGPVIREATLAEYEKDPHAPHHGQHHSVPLQMFEQPHDFNTPRAWGMAVDMNTCIGCNACVIACQAENNVPVVGKENVIESREMHWLRIDRYFKGSQDDPNPDVVYQPMMCVHCENAPCEQVCPVAATVHDTEGLNVMVYNRCIGTRYCSNNCPYKVRRFNYFDWHSKDPRGGRFAPPWLGMPDEQQKASVDRIKQMVFNPEVTVRMRGVMEKCTYCVQRIHNTGIAKRNAGEDLKDGDVVTACQQACPTEAIVFGNLNDRESRVSKLHANARAYSVLEDLNTKPRTRYLAKLRNPAAHEST